MAVSGTDLANAIMDAFASYNDGDYANEKNNPRHKQILGDTIKEYLEENTEIKYSWEAATIPPGSITDPIKKFSSVVEFASFDLTPATSLESLAAAVQSAVLSGVIKHPVGFIVDAGSFTANSNLVFPLSSSASTAVRDSIAIPICTWIITCVNSRPLLGTHLGVYIGSTIGMGIE